MRQQRILEDGSDQTITIKWDGDRFALLQSKYGSRINPRVIVLSPKEMDGLVEFVRVTKEDWDA